MDEPFSALDAFTRMRAAGPPARGVAGAYRPTLLLVTHDLDEAVYLADRVVLMGERPSSIQRIQSVELAQDRACAATWPWRRCARICWRALHLERSAA